MHNKCQLIIKPDHCELLFLDTQGNVSMSLEVKDIEMIGLQGDRWVMVKDRQCESYPGYDNAIRQDYEKRGK